jgi:prepilin-type processing-associated H-X9-DG protein
MKTNDHARIAKPYTNGLYIHHGRTDGSSSDGFTRADLMVVICAMALMTGLLLPGPATGNQQASGTQCLNNFRKLSQAWAMYSTDNSGKLAQNGGEGAQPASYSSADGKPGGVQYQWCPGRQDPGIVELAPANLPAGLVNVGLAWIKDGSIYPYVNTTRVYLCPSDESYDLLGSNKYPHVRSVSMNCWLNPSQNSPWTAGPQDGNMRVFDKQSDLTVPGPANTFLLIDENQQSIGDGWMVEDPSEPTISKPEWIDVPGNRHNGACAISFCDGHVGLKKWRDPVLLSMTQMQDTQNWNLQASNYEPDVVWLANRATALKSTTSFLGPQGW